jgi:hypothetical protein
MGNTVPRQYDIIRHTVTKMPKRSHLERHRAFFHAAAIAAHARFAKEGFRQKDFKFLIELFSNWLEAGFEGAGLEVANMQIARYLDGLVEEGWAKQISGTAPRYRLTRDGLVEQLSRLVDRRHWWPIEDFFFIHYFLDSYRQRIEALIDAAGPLYSGPMKLAIRQLLDVRRFAEREAELLEMEIAKLELRIADSRKTMALVKEGRDRARTKDEILKEIQEKLPYELNNQKPMKELFRETPDENWLWEMEVGSLQRATLIWGPLRDALRHLRGQIAELKTRKGTQPK